MQQVGQQLLIVSGWQAKNGNGESAPCGHLQERMIVNLHRASSVCTAFFKGLKSQHDSNLKNRKPASKRGLYLVHVFPYEVRKNPRERETSTIHLKKRNKRHKSRKEVKLLVETVIAYIKILR